MSAEVLKAMRDLESAQLLRKWGSVRTDTMSRRNVFVGELKRVGILAPEKVAVPSVRNDAVFLFSVVATTSVLAVAAGTLPGDWVSPGAVSGGRCTS